MSPLVPCHGHFTVEQRRATGQQGDDTTSLSLARRRGDKLRGPKDAGPDLPTVAAALTTQEYTKIGVEYLDLNGLVETMIRSQAHTLDAVFNDLARRAAGNLGKYPEAAQSYLPA